MAIRATKKTPVRAAKTPAPAKRECWAMEMEGDPFAPDLNPASLAAVHVDLLDSRLPRLRCRTCQSEWTPPTTRVELPDRIDHALPIGWWQCPSGCTLAHAKRVAAEREGRGRQA